MKSTWIAIPKFALACFVAVCLATAASSPAHATLSYTLGFDQVQYRVTPGLTFTADVILTEIATGGDVPRLAPGGDNGLVLLASEISYSGMTAGGATDNVLRVGSKDFATTDDDGPLPEISFNPIFTEQSYLLDNRISSLLLSGGPPAGTPFESVIEGLTTYRVRLATIEFTAVGLEGDSAVLSIADTGFDVGFSNDTPFPDFPDITTLEASVSISAVPEPTSMLALSVVGGGLTLRRRRRGSRAKVAG
jgi:hypothetical protein